MLQVQALWTFAALHGAGAAADRKGLFVLQKEATVGNDEVEGAFGMAAHEAAMCVAGGYVMTKIYQEVCKIGTPRAAACAFSMLPSVSFVSGPHSVTDLVSNKNLQVRNAMATAGTDATSIKGIEFRLVSLASQLALPHSCHQAYT